MSTYRQRYELDQIRGVSHTPVPTGPVRRHVQALLDAGASSRSVGQAAGVSPSTVRSVAAGEFSTTHRAVAARLMRVTTADVIRTRTSPVDRVPATGTVRRVQALLALGHSHAVITAAMGGVSSEEITRSRRIKWVHFRVYEAAQVAYQELSMKPGANLHTRSLALRLGYAPPLAWDDDAIDDPNAVPDTGQRTRGSLDLDEWLYLVNTGEEPNRAAERCGVQITAVERAAHRARRPDIAYMASSARIRERESVA